MTICYLGLGSNLSSPRRKLIQTIHALEKIPCSAVLQKSQVYHSKPWGVNSFQPDYYNMVILFNTALTPKQLLTYCQKIEKRMGRIRKKQWSPRPIDIDILLYGNRSLSTVNLKIPHPYMLKRDFVLMPLLAISPELKMPNGQEVSKFIKNCNHCIKPFRQSVSVRL